MLIAAPRPAGGAALPPALRSTPPGRNRTGGSVSGTRAPGRRRGGGRSLDDRSRGVVELLELERAPQLLERAGLDLANPLAGDAEMLPGLRQRASHAVMEPVADPQDLLLALAQRAQHAVDLLVLELQLDEMLDRRGGLAQVLRAQLLERLDPRPLVERAQAHDQARQPLRAALGDAELARDVLDHRGAAQPRAQRALGAHEPVDLLEHLHGNPHRARLLRDPAQDRLSDPDRGVGAEPEPALRLEAVDGVNQTEVAFLDQVEHREPAVAVVPSDVDDEPQVGEDHVTPSARVSRARSVRQLNQLRMRKQPDASDLVEV